jgi:hypothetical protein
MIVWFDLCLVWFDQCVDPREPDSIAPARLTWQAPLNAETKSLSDASQRDMKAPAENEFVIPPLGGNFSYRFML